jgi:hypothetical protein
MFLKSAIFVPGKTKVGSVYLEQRGQKGFYLQETKDCHKQHVQNN